MYNTIKTYIVTNLNSNYNNFQSVNLKTKQDIHYLFKIKRISKQMKYHISLLLGLYIIHTNTGRFVIIWEVKYNYMCIFTNYIKFKYLIILIIISILYNS